MTAVKYPVVAAFLAGALPAMAVNEAAQPGVVDAAHESIVATVEDVNHEKRTITLKGPEGNEVTMEAGPQIARFEEVEKGDRLKVDYLESVAVAIVPPDQAEGAVRSGESFLVRNPQSQKPGATAVRTEVVTATVEKIDAAERIATLQGPDSGTLEISIAPDVPNVASIKRGDRVVVEKTRALALNIQE
ncbi:MAG TPA: hypothetical protein VFX02_03155 [Gammaproteobacteria bacterium]|nr:hypothetical protein [Gammaproteobacteria bacterium]